MRRRLFKVLTAAVLSVAAAGTSVAAEEVNTGTNPTLLATTASAQYKYNDLRGGTSTGLFEAVYAQPFGPARHKSLQVTLPYASGVLDNSYALGDVGLKFVHVVDVNERRGFAYTAELLLNSADRPELGRGQTVAKVSGFYARFLPNGSIFAPALVHESGFNRDAGRARVNTTTIDFYYVPKLANPNYFMTYDPAIVRDWTADGSYASLTITFGRVLGKLFGGDSQIFIKPQILIGPDRPVDGSVQVGFKVLGF